MSSASSPPAGHSGGASAGPPAGLCARCCHAKLNHTRRGTTYLRCLRASWDERLVRYPRLPVLSCPGWEPEPDRAAGSDSGTTES
jgi:hypothetical protein